MQDDSDNQLTADPLSSQPVDQLFSEGAPPYVTDKPGGNSGQSKTEEGRKTVQGGVTKAANKLLESFLPPEVVQTKKVYEAAFAAGAGHEGNHPPIIPVQADKEKKEEQELANVRNKLAKETSAKEQLTRTPPTSPETPTATSEK